MWISFTITRETNEELLFTILFFGFRRLEPWPSRERVIVSARFPSPNGGLLAIELPFVDGRASSSASLILRRSEIPPDLGLDTGVWPRRGCTITSEHLTPLVGGRTFVARGFGLTTGASDGWGGGVARCKSSLRTYVPINIKNQCQSTVSLEISHEIAAQNRFTTPSPTCSGQPPSGCFTTLLVSTIGTGIPFAVPVAYATGLVKRGGGGGRTLLRCQLKRTILVCECRVAAELKTPTSTPPQPRSGN